jgi:Uma2 family endonuclease
MSAIAIPHAPTPAPTTPPPATVGPRPWKWSREDYDRLGELGLFDGRRVQLIFGEIIEMGKQGWPHAAALLRLVEVMRRVFASGFWVSEQKPFPIRGSEPEPDLAIIPGRFEDYTDHPTVAVLLIEVADSSLFLDTTTKAELYATAGVREYWVIDLENRQLLVFRDPEALSAGLGATAYHTHLTFGPTDSVSPLAAPQASVKVADLLP